MSRRWQAARRLAFAVIAAYLVVSLVFGFVALSPDPHVADLKYAASRQAGTADIPVTRTDAWKELSAYRHRRHLDEPIARRYLDWMVDVTTLDWGRSLGATAVEYGRGYPANVRVTSLVAGALARTLGYVIPAIVVSVVGGIGVGLYAATHRNSWLDKVGTSLGYLGFSLPNFWLAELGVLVIAGGGWVAGVGEAPHLVRAVVFPAAVLGTSLFAGQLRYARAESLEYVDTAFITYVRAKGASTGRVARHLLRNAAIPLFSLFFADLLGVLVMNVFVIEYVFGIRGLGGLSLVAIQSRDLPVILGASMVIVLLGIVGNLAQDLAYLVFDPRVGE